MLIFATLCVLFYCVYIAVSHTRTLVAGLLARSQYPEGPATGHLSTGFSWLYYYIMIIILILGLIPVMLLNLPSEQHSYN
jgi:surface polysaccharide O-acyltransferase-like enzyme